MIDRLEQTDAVLAEDGRAVVLYRYSTDESLDVSAATVVLPLAVEERNFLRSEWEWSSMRRLTPPVAQ